MQFEGENLIVFGSHPGAAGVESKAFVTMAEADGRVHVGFAHWTGKSPTNAFEALARFVWAERYPDRPFSDFRWYDCQTDLMRAGRRPDGTGTLLVRPVRVDGHASRRRAGGLLPDKDVTDAPRAGDERDVSDPDWGRNIPLDELPPAFREAVERDLIARSRAEAVI